MAIAGFAIGISLGGLAVLTTIALLAGRKP
jgi:hypothetical protein